MPRWKETGTGPGDIVGEAQADFFASDSDNRIRSCAIQWTGDRALLPFLPGIAFDQYFPNLRSIQMGGRVLRAKEAQAHALAAFEAWVEAAESVLSSNGAGASFNVAVIGGPQSGEEVRAKATMVVRTNEQHERLWGETRYSANEARDLLFSAMYQVIWDWMIATATSPEIHAMVTALQHQFEYYAVHGIPSDFLMRQIGKAPYFGRLAIPGDSAGRPVT